MFAVGAVEHVDAVVVEIFELGLELSCCFLEKSEVEGCDWTLQVWFSFACFLLCSCLHPAKDVVMLLLLLTSDFVHVCRVDLHFEELYLR